MRRTCPLRGLSQLIKLSRARTKKSRIILIFQSLADCLLTAEPSYLYEINDQRCSSVQIFKPDTQYLNYKRFVFEVDGDVVIPK
jgi:hypothetical protein